MCVGGVCLWRARASLLLLLAPFFLQHTTRTPRLHTTTHNKKNRNPRAQKKKKVLGFCFLVGGLRYKVQSFNAVASQVSGSLLFLTAISILMPTAAEQLGLSSAPGAERGMAPDAVLLLSRLT